MSTIFAIRWKRALAANKSSWKISTAIRSSCSNLLGSQTLEAFPVPGSANLFKTRNRLEHYDGGCDDRHAGSGTESVKCFHRQLADGRRHRPKRRRSSGPIVASGPTMACAGGHRCHIEED